MTPADLRTVARRLPTGVTVVTGGRGGETHGMTVNSFTTLSLTPPLVSFSVRHTARIRGLIESTGGFTVNVLAAEQAGLAGWFADRNRPTGADSFLAVETAGAPAAGGVRIAGAVGHFVCRTVRLVEAGDHVIVIGSVEECEAPSSAEPLLFVDGEFRSLPGRPAGGTSPGPGAAG
ncbi:flavin reductase [Streptomyces sp. NA02950]|uniref:flavin reductase family protein n=1 Tax=Streptomyces sp. NA02950 TaxID=2742137 RepID=UPI0015925C9D|nr:flavin reductase family protein [Streptomyces sp. NA02950]QKV91489.1 flavin reductase [Streptomyces sp. NA02950]